MNQNTPQPYMPRGAFSVPGVRVDLSPPADRLPPPSPGIVQDVRTFPIMGEMGNAARGRNLRVVMIGGSPWFAAADVCAVLEIGNPSDAVRRLDDDEYRQVAAALVSIEGRPQDRLNLVSEAGLYSLIMGSRKPEARAFKRWVTHEVLPQIRKTGAYTVQRELSRRELLEIALEAEKAKERMAKENIGLRQDLVQVEADRRSITAANVQARELLGRAEEALTEAKPKVEGYEQLLNSDGNYSLATAAQAVGLGRQKFIQKLAEYGGLIVRPGTSDHLRPYQGHVQCGRFVVKVRVFDVVKDGVTESRSEGTTYVTPKGLDWFRGKQTQEATRRSQNEVTDQ